jgi:hypothetical protein
MRTMPSLPLGVPSHVVIEMEFRLPVVNTQAAAPTPGDCVGSTASDLALTRVDNTPPMPPIEVP